MKILAIAVLFISFSLFTCSDVKKNSNSQDVKNIDVEAVTRILSKSDEGINWEPETSNNNGSDEDFDVDLVIRGHRMTGQQNKNGLIKTYEADNGNITIYLASFLIISVLGFGIYVFFCDRQDEIFRRLEEEAQSIKRPVVIELVTKEQKQRKYSSSDDDLNDKTQELNSNTKAVDRKKRRNKNN